MTWNTPNNISQEENDSWKDQNMWIEGWGHLSARSHVYSLLTPHRFGQRWMDEPYMPQHSRGRVHPGSRAKDGAKPERYAPLNRRQRTPKDCHGLCYCHKSLLREQNYCRDRRWTGCNSLHPCLSTDHIPGVALPHPWCNSAGCLHTLPQKYKC